MRGQTSATITTLAQVGLKVPISKPASTFGAGITYPSPASPPPQLLSCRLEDVIQYAEWSTPIRLRRGEPLFSQIPALDGSDEDDCPPHLPSVLGVVREEVVSKIGRLRIVIEREEERAIALDVEPRLRHTEAGTTNADLAWLRTALRWGQRRRIEGEWLIRENPLDRLTLPGRNRNERRPVAFDERYRAKRDKADKIDPKGRIRAMLAIARYTGRRIRSICALKASDVLWTAQEVGEALAAMGVRT